MLDELFEKIKRRNFSYVTKNLYTKKTKDNKPFSKNYSNLNTFSISRE